MLPPEPEYFHVLGGLGALGSLVLVLVLVAAWRLGHVGVVAPALIGVALLTVLATTVFQIRRRYRHVVAGILVLGTLLGLLLAAIQCCGYVTSVILTTGPTTSARAESSAAR